MSGQGQHSVVLGYHLSYFHLAWTFLLMCALKYSHFPHDLKNSQHSPAASHAMAPPCLASGICLSASLMAGRDRGQSQWAWAGTVAVPKIQSLSPCAVTLGNVERTGTFSLGRNFLSQGQEPLQPCELHALANPEPHRELGLINSALWHPDTSMWLLVPKPVFLRSNLLYYLIHLITWYIW